MKKYITPTVEIDVLSKNDVIMASGDPELIEGELLAGVSAAWFGMEIE